MMVKALVIVQFVMAFFIEIKIYPGYQLLGHFLGGNGILRCRSFGNGRLGFLFLGQCLAGPPEDKGQVNRIVRAELRLIAVLYASRQGKRSYQRYEDYLSHHSLTPTASHS